MQTNSKLQAYFEHSKMEQLHLFPSFSVCGEWWLSLLILDSNLRFRKIQKKLFVSSDNVIYTKVTIHMCSAKTESKSAYIYKAAKGKQSW